MLFHENYSTFSHCHLKASPTPSSSLYFRVVLHSNLIIPGINEAQGKHQRDTELRDLFYVHAQPEFDARLPTNVSAVLGRTAFLTCVVRNLKPSQKV